MQQIFGDGSSGVFKVILAVSQTHRHADYNTAHTGRATLQWKASFCSPSVCYLFIYFNVFCQINYLSIYRADLHHICRLGITINVDERI